MRPSGVFEDMAIPHGSIRILIVDNHAVVRAGLSMLIENNPGMTVAGGAGNREEALRILLQERVDIILVDIDLGGENSLDFLRDLVDAAGDAKLLILTGVREPEQHRRAIRLGAMGIVLKEKAPEILIKAIERVHAGEAWIDRSVTATVLAEMVRSPAINTPSTEAVSIASLTKREYEIISLVCQGLKNNQISERLCISESTARNHLTSILSKLNLSDRLDLALYSFRHGLVQPPGRNRSESEEIGPSSYKK